MSLPELLERAARHHPTRGVELLDARGRGRTRRAYPELAGAVRRSAGRLASLGVEPGEVVLLSLDTSFELLECWLALVELGALPVNLAPIAGFGAGEGRFRRVERLLGRLGARRFLCTEATRRELEAAASAALLAAATTPAMLDALLPAAPPPAPRDPELPAFLQLTSGSTGHPRAVVIPHRAALHNVRAIAGALEEASGGASSGSEQTVVSWLPLHHDMGLVGCLLYPLSLGHDLVLMPPRLFLARPERWLRELSGRGPAISPAPSFGYQTCLERAAEVDVELADADLSGWHTALIGAEMVRPATMAGFAERFAPLGFAPRALRPCYGLAEGTLAVTFDVRGQGVRTAPVPGEAERQVVCVGAPVLETALEIRSPAGDALAENTVGEVFVRGPGVFAGYHGDPEASAECLVDGWLRTGDLGFLARGELHLTGRSKDILIVRGHNLMPHELEWCAEAVAGAGGTARAGAFSVDAGAAGEAAVIVVELTDLEPARAAELGRAVRVRVGRELGLVLADVAFVRRGRIPKTTSGKVQRGELRRRYLAGELERLDAAAPPVPAATDAGRAAERP